MFADGIEFFEAIVRLQGRTHKATGIPVDSTPARTTISALCAGKIKVGLTAQDRHLEMRDMAKEVGLLDEYLDINRIYSKLVHRTAFSVLAFSNTGELAYIAPFMFNVGSTYGLQVWEMLEEHIITHGMKSCAS